MGWRTSLFVAQIVIMQRCLTVHALGKVAVMLRMKKRAQIAKELTDPNRLLGGCGAGALLGGALIHNSIFHFLSSQRFGPDNPRGVSCCLSILHTASLVAGPG